MADFYDCNKLSERLSSTDVNDAAERFLDECGCERWPDDLPVYAWKRDKRRYRAYLSFREACPDVTFIEFVRTHWKDVRP